MNSLFWFLLWQLAWAPLKWCITSVPFSSSAMFDSLRPHGLQHTRPPCPSPTLGAYSNSCPWWVGDAIQPSHPLLSPSSPTFNLSQHQGLFKWVSSSHQALPMNFQDWFPLGLTGWISLQFKDSQAFSPTPQFESINSSVLSFLDSPTLTSIHDD